MISGILGRNYSHLHVIDTAVQVLMKNTLKPLMQGTIHLRTDLVLPRDGSQHQEPRRTTEIRFLEKHHRMERILCGGDLRMMK